RIKIDVVIERRIKIFQTYVLDIFFRQNGILHRNLPINTQTFILDTDTSIRFGGIEIIALVLEYGCFAQYGKTMRKASWYEELAVIIFGQFHSYMLSIGRTAFTNIHCHIQYTSFHATYQFTLRKGRPLEV